MMSEAAVKNNQSKAGVMKRERTKADLFPTTAHPDVFLFTVLAAPARFTKKYSEVEIFTFSAHSSAQLHTEVSDASVQVTTDSGAVLIFCIGFYR